MPPLLEAPFSSRTPCNPPGSAARPNRWSRAAKRLPALKATQRARKSGQRGARPNPEYGKHGAGLGCRCAGTIIPAMELKSDNPEHGFQFPGNFELSAMGPAEAALERVLPQLLTDAGIDVQ